MLVFGAPLMLLAGALAALLPVALHLIRPRPGARQPLPTARFLTPETRSRVRLGPPDQPLLLALRILLLLLVAAALALPGWLPAARGRAEVVLLDRAAGDADGWRRAVAETRARLLPESGPSRGALVLFDSTGRLVPPGAVTPRLLDSLASQPPARRSDLAAALAQVPAAVRASGAVDSLRLSIVSPLSAAGWGAGTGALRPAAWPGRVGIVAVEGPPRDPPAPGARRTAAVWARPGAGDLVSAAAAAAGLPPASAADSAAAVFVLRTITAAEEARLGGAATVVRQEGAGTRLAGAGAVVLDGLDPVPGAGRRTSLVPAPGERVVATWEEGGAAAVASRQGATCRVRFGADLEAGALPRGAGYPHLVARLASACEGTPATHSGSLDAGGRRLLAGAGPEWVSARTLGSAAPVPLGRWLLALAVVTALAEMLLARRRTA